MCLGLGGLRLCEHQARQRRERDELRPRAFHIALAAVWLFASGNVEKAFPSASLAGEVHLNHRFFCGSLSVTVGVGDSGKSSGNVEG